MTRPRPTVISSLLLVALAIGACGTAPIGSVDAPADVASASPTASATASIGIRLVYQTPQPPEITLDNTVVQELSTRVDGATCFVSGDVLVVVTAEIVRPLAERLGRPPGWLDEPTLFLGSRDALVDALDREVLAEDDGEFWVLLDLGRLPSAQQYLRRLTFEGNDVFRRVTRHGVQDTGGIRMHRDKGSVDPPPGVEDNEFNTDQFSRDSGPEPSEE